MKINGRIRAICLTSTLFTAITLLPSLGSTAEFYKWTDEKGNTHYSDKPPTGVDAKTVKYKKKKASEQDSNEESSEATAEKSDSSAKRCEAEKQRLSVLQNNSKVSLKTQDGQVKDLSPEEIQQEIAKTEKAIAYFCDE